ncbi:MAG: exopolysaccharide biosynthesis polyprenyl glycosylphosphotransferase [Flavobacteriales bacterium]|nr:exopolysaccharide biosynthesis polyprenyl glycosylphosphotransferase [Flavobacteriales bacterium]
MKIGNFINLFYIQLVLDCIPLGILFFYFLFIQYDFLGISYTFDFVLRSHYKAFILIFISWFTISGTTKLYRVYRQTGIVEVYRRLVYQIFVFGIVIFAISGLKTHNLYSNQIGFRFLVCLLFITFSTRFFLFLMFKLYRNYGGNYINSVFVDTNHNTPIFEEILTRRKDYGYRIVKNYFEYESFDIDEFENYLMNQNIQNVYLSMDGTFPKDTIKKIDYICEKNHITLNYIPSSSYVKETFLRLDYYETFPILNYKYFPLDSMHNQVIKRSFDVVISLLVIIGVFSWLFPLIMLVIYIDSGRPIFFLQKRSGYKGEDFYCYKFRTMVINKHSDIKHTVKGDSRITKLGVLLRKTSIDELPQFFNVLKGDMSLVGPRPHMIVQNEYYSDIINRYNLRHYVKPGITGLAQIKGYRGEINSNIDMERRITADVFYIKNWSFSLDLVIMFKTLYKMIVGDKNAI